MVKVSGWDVPPPGETTSTGSEPAAARSAAAIAACSWAPLTNVVGRDEPFQRTSDPMTKPLPFTVSVKPARPSAARVGVMLRTTGTGADRSGRSTRVLSKVAVTAVLPLIVHVQVDAVPLQALLQPVKVEPVPATAVRVTTVPGAIGPVQTGPQSIPAGALETVPPPVPVFVTEISTGGGRLLKVATTVVARLIATVQGAVPLQAPLQPAKVEPAAAAAVSVN
jgi:hypothetical protein